MLFERAVSQRRPFASGGMKFRFVPEHLRFHEVAHHSPLPCAQRWLGAFRSRRTEPGDIEVRKKSANRDVPNFRGIYEMELHGSGNLKGHHD